MQYELHLPSSGILLLTEYKAAERIRNKPAMYQIAPLPDDASSDALEWEKRSTKPP